MGVTTTKTNKPFNPRGNDQSPKGYNRAALYSGKALDFDGVNDSVSVSYSETLGGIWSWVSIIEADALSGYQQLFSGEYTVTNASIYLKENQLTFYTNQNNLNTSFDFETGKKYHVACSQSGDTISVFVNGQAAGSVSLTIPLNSANGSYVIGKHPNQATEYFNGKISGVKLFNTALTAEQVADLYNNPEKVVPTGVDNTALKLWLPMMEGAGTTAYDGSGNGNHGTISGATYVNGIGAPVSQTAVIDWNKGVNLLDYSDIQQTQGSAAARRWTEGGSNPWTPLNATGPTGLANSAGTYTKTNNVANGDYLYASSLPTTSGETYTMSAWVKLGTASNAVIVLNGSSAWNTISGANYVATAANGYNEWKQVSITYTAVSTNLTNIHIGYHQETGVDAQANGTFYVYGVAIHKGSTPILVPTNGTAQTSEVLLPQGLTTGRDITGVNLFENVRKQGALNLDGNSWAEVHDNASLDIGEITLECWINSTDKDQYHHILSKNKSGNTSYAILTEITTGYLGFEAVSGEFKKTDYNVMDGNWNHIVVTYDETNLKFYINGALDDTIAYTSAIPTNDVDLHIGARPDGVQLFESDIAQPRIYNRALTASEVLRNYNSGKNTYTND